MIHSCDHAIITVTQSEHSIDTGVVVGGRGVGVVPNACNTNPHHVLRRRLPFFVDCGISTGRWQIGHRPETSVSHGSRQVFCAVRNQGIGQ